MENGVEIGPEIESFTQFDQNPLTSKQNPLERFCKCRNNIEKLIFYLIFKNIFHKNVGFKV